MIILKLKGRPESERDKVVELALEEPREGEFHIHAYTDGNEHPWHIADIRNMKLHLKKSLADDIGFDVDSSGYIIVERD